MGTRYTVCTVQIRKMPVPERYMHVYWAGTLASWDQPLSDPSVLSFDKSGKHTWQRLS